MSLQDAAQRLGPLGNRLQRGGLGGPAPGRGKQHGVVPARAEFEQLSDPVLEGVCVRNRRSCTARSSPWL